MATYNEKEDCFGLPIKSRVDLAGSVTYYDYFGNTRRSFTLQIKRHLFAFLPVHVYGWMAGPDSLHPTSQDKTTRRRRVAEAAGLNSSAVLCPDGIM